jgi:L-ascorbate metabolism protein UlaG (beta-lactamase superfamily)
MPSASRKIVNPLLLFFFLSCAAALQADVTITRLANAGVILSDGDARVMIDGMVVEPYAVYGGLPDSAAADFARASGEFSGIDLALVSHRHHEHNQPEYACRFLQNSPDTELYSSEQVIGLVREFCRELTTGSGRVHRIEPQYGQPHVIEREGIRVTVFPLSHGTHKYARIRNYGHLVEIGGVKVLHVGDAAFEPADFEKAGLADIQLDVALIPIAYFQPGPGIEIVERYLNAPVKIAVHIPPGEMEETRQLMAESYPQVFLLEEPMRQLRFSAAAPPPP